MEVISIRDNPERLNETINYVYKKWGNVNNSLTLRDCIEHSVDVENALPRWYILIDEDKIIGCAALLVNDYISRMDLTPWISSLYIDQTLRGNAYGSILLTYLLKEAKRLGYPNLFLCTDYTGYYEKYGFTYMGMGYHPWGTSSRIYMAECLDE